MTNHDTVLQGGPQDGTTLTAGGVGLIEIEADGLLHRYVPMTRQGGPDGRLSVYTYDGEVDPQGASDGAEDARNRAASPLADQMQGEDRG